MLTNMIESLRRERARFARNVEYIREGMKEDELSDLMEKATSLYAKETYEDTLNELKEAAEVVEKISDDDTLMEAADIERILNAETDITFDEMVGIEKGDEEYGDD